MLYQLQRHLQGYQSWAQVHLWSPHSSELHQNLLCSPAFMKGRQCLSLPTEEHIRNLVSWAFFDSSNSAPLVSSSTLSISVLDSSVGVPSVPIAITGNLRFRTDFFHLCNFAITCYSRAFWYQTFCSPRLGYQHQKGEHDSSEYCGSILRGSECNFNTRARNNYFARGAAGRRSGKRWTCCCYLDLSYSLTHSLTFSLT